VRSANNSPRAALTPSSPHTATTTPPVAGSKARATVSFTALFGCGWTPEGLIASPLELGPTTPTIPLPPALCLGPLWRAERDQWGAELASERRFRRIPSRDVLGELEMVAWKEAALPAHLALWTVTGTPASSYRLAAVRTGSSDSDDPPELDDVWELPPLDWPDELLWDEDRGRWRSRRVHPDDRVPLLHPAPVTVRTLDADLALGVYDTAFVHGVATLPAPHHLDLLLRGSRAGYVALVGARLVAGHVRLAAMA
jgi:hypothetical protein